MTWSIVKYVALPEIKGKEMEGAASRPRGQIDPQTAGKEPGHAQKQVHEALFEESNETSEKMAKKPSWKSEAGLSSFRKVTLSSTGSLLMMIWRLTQT